MKKFLLILTLVLNTKCFASDTPSNRRSPNSRDLLALLAFASSSYCLAQNITATADSATKEPVLATLYFIYVQTWIGNVYGFFDLTGWGFDWVSNWLYYQKGETPEVEAARELIEERKQLRRKKFRLASKLCNEAIKCIKENRREEVHEMLACVREALPFSHGLEEDEPMPSEHGANP